MNDPVPPADAVSQTTESAASSSGAYEKLPPPRFETLVQLLASQAVLAMGMIPGPNGDITKELPLARHFIDLLGILEDRTKGNLSPVEAKVLDSALHELRMTFVHASRS